LSKAEQKQANAEQEISNLKPDNKRLMERIDELEKDWNDVDDNESVEDENEEDEEDQETIIKSKKGRTKHKEESKSRTYKLDPSLKKFSGRGDVEKFISFLVGLGIVCLSNPNSLINWFLSIFINLREKS